MKNKIDKEFDEEFTHKDAFGSGCRFFTSEGTPEAIKAFYNSKIKELLTELAGKEDESLNLDSSPKGFEKAFFKKGYNVKRQEILNLRKELNN